MPVKNPPVSPPQGPASNSSVSTLLGIPKNTPLLWGETWSLALQALRANKVRAMLTMLGVIIGSACIVLVVTVALAGRIYITSLIEGVGSNLIYGELVHTSENQHAAQFRSAASGKRMSRLGRDEIIHTGKNDVSHSNEGVACAEHTGRGRAERRDD